MLICKNQHVTLSLEKDNSNESFALKASTIEIRKEEFCTTAWCLYLKEKTVTAVGLNLETLVTDMSENYGFLRFYDILKNPKNLTILWAHPPTGGFPPHFAPLKYLNF